MSAFYQKLKEELGEAAAKQYMRDIRKNVVSHPGGSFNDPETAREAQKLSTQAKKEKKLIEEAHANKDS